jgi:hypothetical protein
MVTISDARSSARALRGFLGLAAPLPPQEKAQALLDYHKERFQVLTRPLVGTGYSITDPESGEVTILVSATLPAEEQAGTVVALMAQTLAFPAPTLPKNGCREEFIRQANAQADYGQRFAAEFLK